MLLSTPGLVLHTTPYSESSVVVKVFTRQLGVRSYIIKGVRGRGGRVKQNLLQPLSSLDMVVYNNDKTNLNYIKELSPRPLLGRGGTEGDGVGQSNEKAIKYSLCFFMTEVLYKALREAEPMPALFDYVDSVFNCQLSIFSSGKSFSDLPITFLLTVARHLGIEPLDNHSSREPYFDLQEGRFVSAPTETPLSPDLSITRHAYLLSSPSLSLPLTPFHSPLDVRTALINALLQYYHLHLSGFSHFHSHEILHTVLK